MCITSKASEQKKLDWLRLIRTKNVGPKSFQSLMNIYGSADKALEAIPHLSKKGGSQIKPFSVSEANKEIDELKKRNAQIVIACESLYPRLLRDLNDLPPVLTVLGRVDCLDIRSVAIVGSRNCSANGCKIAGEMGKTIGKNKYMVTSGLARGIDTAAHKGALSTGTIAVVAGGIDNIYPPENKKLFYDITENGAIIAEMKIGTSPKPQYFPRRNRIIAGMSVATVVVEAAIRSGSLITAKFALEQDREVFGVPGSPLDPRCKGPNTLIREGAFMAESGIDVVNVLGNLHYTKPFGLFDKVDGSVYNAPTPKISEDDVDKARVIIHEKLGPTPTNIDDIITQTGISANIVMVVLLELELAGKMERHPGNKVSVYNFNDDFFEEAI